MEIKAIVYTSMTGFTAEYARMLSDRTALPAYTLEEAAKKLPEQEKVLFMGWLMAGALVDYKKAAQRYDIMAACAVGLNATPKQQEATRKSTKIPSEVPLFALQGGYRPQRLAGMYRFMMKIVTRVLIRKIDSAQNKSAEEEAMLQVLRHGGSFVKEENLAPVLAFLQK